VSQINRVKFKEALMSGELAADNFAANLYFLVVLNRCQECRGVGAFLGGPAGLADI
jgi:hypothetical protein